MKPKVLVVNGRAILLRALSTIRWTLFVCLVAMASNAMAEDRVARYEELERAYKEADESFNADYPGKKGTPEESIKRYEVWPAWTFIPRFIDLAEEQPDDEAARRSCRWIIDRSYNVGVTDKQLYYTDAKAWNFLAKHHATHADFAALCLEASHYASPAREQFLRAILERKDLPRTTTACATLALAEQLANRHETITILAEAPKVDDPFLNFIRTRQAREWETSISVENTPKIKTESAALFRATIKDFGSLRVPAHIGEQQADQTLGARSQERLNGLLHLSIGSIAPVTIGQEIHGRPLRLSDYRGKVVVVSIWFTGCGPCMEMIPQEQKLVKAYADKPFALLAVNSDATREQAIKTMDVHKMTWPCWQDGDEGPIVRDWNVQSFPGIFVLDAKGVIRGKQLRDEGLDAKVAELIKAML